MIKSFITGLFLAALVLLVSNNPVQGNPTKADPTDVASSRPDVDEEPDGLTNQEEAEMGTYPYNEYSDGDEVIDGEDGWALVTALAPARLPRPVYALIEVGGAESTGREINASGVCLIESTNNEWCLWENRQLSAIYTPPNRSLNKVYGLTDDKRLLASTGEVAGTPVRHNEAWARSPLGVWQECSEPASLQTVVDTFQYYLSIEGYTMSASCIGPDGTVYGYAANGVAYGNGSADIYGSYVWQDGNGSVLGYQLGVCSGEARRVYNGFYHDYAVNPTYTANIGDLENNTVPLDYAADGNTFLGITINKNDVTLAIRQTYDDCFYAVDLAQDERGPDLSGGSYTLSLIANVYNPQVLLALGSINDKIDISNQNTVILKQTSGETTLWLDQTAGTRNNQPVNSNPNFTRLDWIPDFGEAPPVTLNAQMRGYSGNCIWQNTRSYEINQLVPATIGTNSTWSNVRISEQNDEGLIIGTANNNTTGKDHAVMLIPFDLVSDSNNDGKINDIDRSLRTSALKIGASDKEKEKGTEYVFANDNLSNGAWDVEDQGAMAYSYQAIDDFGASTGYIKLPKPPASHKNDDDVETLEVTVALTWGKLWFDHPAINNLEFYKTKECKPEDKINIKFESPFDLSQGEMPKSIYVRVENEENNATSESTGDLRLFLTKDSPSEILAETKLPLTIVRNFGAKHFFNAARDYIFENNTKVFIRDHGYPSGPNPSIVFRLCVLREEATNLIPFDAYTADKKGVEAAASSMGEPTVVINGNQCFFEIGLDETDASDLPQMLGYIADSCHGRLIRNSLLAPISSDNYYTGTDPAPGSPLAGPDPIPETGEPGGKYVVNSNTAWNFAAGRASGANALGGLSTYYASPERADKAHQAIGFAKGAEAGKGCIFTATEIKGAGAATIFKSDASSSGVEALSPSADTGAIKLFILDSGAGSLGLMHIDPSGTLRGAYIGRKSKFGFPYYVADYLGFKSTAPRP